MPASSFAQLIISKLAASIGNDGSGFSASTPAVANQAIADAITEYITANTQVMSSYTGMIPATPSPIPDPIVADVHQVVGQCAPPVGVDFDSWWASLGLNIQTGFTIQPGTAGVSYISPVLPFALGQLQPASSVQSSIKSIAESNKDNPQQPVWEAIAQEILNMINNYFGGGGPASNSGSGSTGDGVVTGNVIA